MDEAWPTNVMLTKLDAVKGQVLDKMCLLSQDQGVRVYLVRKPTMLELAGQCDMCLRQHQKNNTECSMWLHKQSYASEFEVLYDPKTKRMIQGWTLVDVETNGVSRISKETYVKQ